MNILYYPGCTMKSWAVSETQAVLEVLAQAGFEMTEMDRWPCCGSAEPLVEENLIKMAAPFRILSQAAAISSTLVTICPICHRVLRSVLQAIRRNPAKRSKLEDFCEVSAPGALEVVHWLELMVRQEPLRILASSRKMSKGWLKALPYPGCALLRPSEVLSLENFQLLETLLKALEIDISLHPRRVECCGGHQGIVDPLGVQQASRQILEAARADGCSAVVTPCPQCRYNLEKVNEGGIFVRVVASASMVTAVGLGISPERFLHPADSLSRKEWEELQATTAVP